MTKHDLRSEKWALICASLEQALKWEIALITESRIQHSKVTKRCSIRNIWLSKEVTASIESEAVIFNENNCSSTTKCWSHGKSEKKFLEENGRNRGCNKAGVFAENTIAWNYKITPEGPQS